MAPEIALKPLKMPSQKRSWATYNAILEATTYILIEDGYEALTTNHVAARAGVSIASLYQYFPNKESLVATLHHHHAHSTRQIIQEKLLITRDAPLIERIDIFVDTIIEIHNMEPELHHIFQQEMPRLIQDVIIKEGNDTFLEAMILLTDNASTIGIGKSNLAWDIRVLVHTLIHQGIIDRKADVSSGLLSHELKIILRKILL